MFHQYHAQRFRSLYPAKPKKVGRRIMYERDPRDRNIGTIGIGTILYIQDGVRPLGVFSRPFVRREPWMVEAWLPRENAKWNPASRSFTSTRIAGGHLAVVRSLRNRNSVATVADWILLACIDAGLEKLCSCAPPFVGKDVPGFWLGVA